MDYRLIFDFFNKFWNDDLVIIYSGHFNDKSLISLTDIIGHHYQLSENQNKYKGRFVYLTVESFQNVIRYSRPVIEGLEMNENYNFFYTRKVDDDFFISTANVVDHDMVDLISERIDEINGLEEEELNKKYKEVLLNQAFSEQGGAGLGFIEMSRKTKQKLEYSFKEIRKNILMYYLALNFLSPKSQENNIHNFKEDSPQEIHKIFSDNNIVLFIKHQFNEDVNEAIFRATELNMIGEDLMKKKIIFQLSVEALQNISKHAFLVDGKKEGIFYIRKENKDYVITTGNYIHNLDVDYLNDFLKILKSNDKNELNKLYLRSITSKEDFDGNGGLGFIDIARDAKEFYFKFFKINENYSFFVLVFKV